MAAPRKRPSTGFTAKPIEEKAIDSEQAAIDTFLEEAAAEVFEVTEPEPEPEPAPFVEEAIAPTEDPGPRFVEVATPGPAPVAAAPPEPRAPKRHPRNIPKFSRIKK